MRSSKRTRPLIGGTVITVLVSAAFAAAFVVAGPGTAITISNYVAMGDSYSAGVGAGGHGSGGNCERSSQSYPADWARANSPAASVSVACADARVSDVTDSQVPALSASTSLVSLTIGGNDVGFASVMTTCNLRGTDACVDAVSRGEVAAGTQLPDKLALMFAAIERRAPDARVVVLGYPHFYDLDHDCVGLSQKSRAKVDEGIDVLDAVLAQAAADAHATFADVRDEFDGHEICDAHRWLHSLNFLDLEESYHPTATGQADGYFPAFALAARV